MKENKDRPRNCAGLEIFNECKKSSSKILASLPSSKQRLLNLPMINYLNCTFTESECMPPNMIAVIEEKRYFSRPKYFLKLSTLTFRVQKTNARLKNTRIFLRISGGLIRFLFVQMKFLFEQISLCSDEICLRQNVLMARLFLTEFFHYDLNFYFV